MIVTTKQIAKDLLYDNFSFNEVLKEIFDRVKIP